MDPADRVSAARPGWNVKARLAVALCPALLGPSQVFLFGPHTLYVGNVGEFILSFWTLAAPSLLALLATLTVLLVLALLCPQRLYPAYVTFLFGAGVALWLQGNLLVGDLALLDGTAIDWGEHRASGVGQSALWIVFPTLLAVFGRRLVSLAARASGVVIVAQVLLVAISTVQPSSSGASHSLGWSEPPRRMFHLSSARNIVHFVLDGFQGDIFSEVIATDEALRRELSGFVFFADHAGAFPTTIMSIPAMLTGVAYRNETPIEEFLARHLRQRSLLTVLADHGYELDLTSITGEHFRGPTTQSYVLPTPYVGYDDYRRAASAKLIDLSIFRHAPAALKQRIYNEQEWLLQNLASTTRSHHSSNGRAFLLDTTQRLEVARDAPVYKLIHVGIPHLPVVLDGECRFTGVTPATREASVAQSRCAIETIVDFLRRLREFEVYDSSLILLTSDHGSGSPPPDFVFDTQPPVADLRGLAGGASALLVVKRPGNSGPLEVSQAPSAITDIAATVLDAMSLPAELPGTSAFRLDPTQGREREYAHYEWDSADWKRQYLPTLEVYSVRGPLRRSSSWSPLGTIRPRTTVREPPTESTEH